MSKSKIRDQTLDLRKNGPVVKTGPIGLKPLSFISSHMKDNAEMIHFRVKNNGGKDLVFVQIKCTTTNFYFENSEVNVTTTNANL